MASSSKFEEYTINGVKIKFPFKPYPSQFTMMDKIIKCIERRQNSLLESPTGSGKSLALLCSSIAWLMVEKERVLKQQLELEKSLCDLSADQDNLKPSCCSSNSIPAVKEEKCSDVAGAGIKEPLSCKIETNASLPSEIKIKIEKPAGSGDKIPLKIEPNDAEVSADNQAQAANNSSVVVKMEQKEPEETAEPSKNDVSMEDDDLSDDGDFQAPKKRFRTTPAGQSIPSAKKRKQSGGDLEDPTVGTTSKHPEWSMELSRPVDVSTNNPAHNTSPCKSSSSCLKSSESDVNVDPKKKDLENGRSLLDQEDCEIPPKIYFGTRTHKQITQIVRELNKTEYNKTKMCILASREHTCIHPQVSKSKNKNDECRKSVENREGKSCSFYARARHVTCQEDLEDYGITKAWNIEELVELGERVQECPYYMTRDILKDADIVFCPYNYLIDPIIRKQMEIHLSDQIVILDEAHNIEDCCREAASWSVTTHSLDEAMADLDDLVKRNIHREQHEVLHAVCATMRRWILEKSERFTSSEFAKSSKIWEGKELRQALDHLGFMPQTIRILLRHFARVSKAPEQPSVRRRERTNMNAGTGKLFEGLFMVLSFLLKDDYKFLCDYRVAITQEFSFVPAVLPNGFRRKGEFERKLLYTLNFWCLSPAVAFLEIGERSRSVILTSGTLSPMSTFSSELGCKFPIQLEANHVVGNSQVWVSTLSVGPTGSTLNATYRFSETFAFQDEVGEAIYRVCEVVPHGVLCFFPSYSMLDKLMKRWKATNLWRRLNRIKNTYSEPRGGDKTDFSDMMNDFYDSIKLSEDSDCTHGASGALFLAVCRGKVSEGLDFADNNARAVITIGIPFPNVKDTKVELKRKYNNQYCSARGLLNGSEWYEIQAYRALNQALGRCIRHRNDWGAILLIDERFGKSPKYRNGLSKWIRNKVVHHNNFPNVLSSLKNFAQARLEDPCPNSSVLQTPSSISRRSSDSNETKSSHESPISINSSSQSSQTPSSTPEDHNKDISGCKEEPGSTTPIPNCSETSPQQLPASWSKVARLRNFQYTPQKPTNQNSSSAHVIGGQETQQVFVTANQIAEEKHVAVSTTPVTPLFVSANQISSSTPVVGRSVAPKVLCLTPLARPQLAGSADSPQRMIHPQQINNPQSTSNPQLPPPAGMTKPVFLRLVTPRGQPVRQQLFVGQQVELSTPVPSMGSYGNNGVVLKIVGGGQQCTSMAQNGGLVQLGDVVRLNTTGQPGIKMNITGQPGLNIPEKHATGSTLGVIGEAQVDHEGQMSTPSLVRVEKSGNVKLLGTSGVKEGLQVTQEDIHGKKMQKIPLFSSQSQDRELKFDADGKQGSSPRYQNHPSKPSNIGGCGVTQLKEVMLPRSGSPDSPLLFATPPTSFENSGDEQDEEGDQGVVRVKLESMDTAGGGMIVGEKVGNEDNAGSKEKEVRVKLEPMDTTGDREILEEKECNEMAGITQDNDGSQRIRREGKKKDLLDIVDASVETNYANNITWNVKCKTCDSVFCSGVNSEPRVEDVSTDTFLGKVLSSLFSLNRDKKKKVQPLTTLHLADVNVLQGCCQALAYPEGKQNKQDVKPNSIFSEEESRCYVSLVCKQCKQSRGSRARSSIVAVRAMPCGTGHDSDKSMVWFGRDKVELFSPGVGEHSRDSQ